MRKRLFAFAAVMLLTLSSAWAQQVKYVFYFIGDGMGVNQINVTETYLAALKGKIGFEPITMSSFPVVGMVNTYSATNGVTDSAAGGTALASGKKTKNGAIGVLEDLETPCTSIAVWAQRAGAAVGIATNVAITHATPASFYGHQRDRNMYYEMGKDLCKSGFDFFAGCDFHKPYTKEGEPSLREQARQAGYTILTGGYKEYQKKGRQAEKLILFQSDAQNEKLGSDHLPYALDQDKNDLTLEQITRAGINYLMSKQKNGFFFQIEGGMIDYACHRNDIGCAIGEVLDMDKAVKVAYEFYEQHPDETLIVVTADHETGGISLGRGPYELHLDQLRHQQISVNKLGSDLHKMHQKYGEKYSWDLVKKYLTDNFGLWEQIKLSDEQNKRLENAFQNIMAGKGKDDKTLYQKDDELATAVKHIMSEVALVGWTSGSHSGGYVPVFAIGAGAENFTGRMDNTEVPLRIAKATGWKVR